MLADNCAVSAGAAAPALVGTAHSMQETARGFMRQPVFKGIHTDG